MPSVTLDVPRSALRRPTRCVLIALGVLAMLAPLPAAAANASVGELLATLHDPGGVANQFFGQAVAISGDVAVVGAPQTIGGAGNAYIYVKGTNGWPAKPTRALHPPVTSLGNFGSAVAVSGDTAVVAATNPVSGDGAVYIYVKSAKGWPHEPTVSLGPFVGGHFGGSVAISGSSIIVGSSGTSAGGAAYIFVRDAEGWPTKPARKLTDPVGAAGDGFGGSVAVSGSTAVVGAAGTRSGAGASYIYVKGARGWPRDPVRRLADPGATANDFFGASVSIAKTTAVVGAFNLTKGHAYIYTELDGFWPDRPDARLKDPHVTPEDLFGRNVTTSGNVTIVSAPDFNPHHSATVFGVAYFYVRGRDGWPTEPTVTKDDIGGELGVSLATAGGLAIVGADGTKNNAGTAYILES